MTKIARVACAMLFAASLHVVATTGTSAQTAGKVAAVNHDATGTPPGTDARELVIGNNVVRNEKVQTSAVGSTQILFPDTSTLNVGHASSIVIDEYVYNPQSGTGNMVARLGKGMLRFVGGQISHTSGVTINTQMAAVGIRGGVVTIVYPLSPAYAALLPPGIPNDSKGELIIGHVGTETVTNGTGSVTLSPGYATFVTGPNAPIPEPFRIPDALLQMVMNNLTSRPGQHGGAITLPTDQMASRTGLGLGNLPDPAHPPGTDPLGYTSIFDAGNGTATNKSQSSQPSQTVPIPTTN